MHDYVTMKLLKLMDEMNFIHVYKTYSERFRTLFFNLFDGAFDYAVNVLLLTYI